MFKLLLNLLICVIIQIRFVENWKCTTNVKPRIVGGEDVFFNDYPYMAAILKKEKNDFLCGGTIIRSDWIITAAHCAEDLTAKEMYVRVGSSRTDYGGQKIKVLTLIVHNKYNQFTLESDVAMLGLGKRMILSETVAPLKLPEAGYKLPLPGAFIRILGWGVANKPLDQEYLKLRELELPIINWDSCQHIFKDFIINLKNSMFCADGSYSHEGGCYGDSGGPAIHNDKLIGIVSWSKDCTRQNHPLVLIRVDLAIEWIEKVMVDYTYNFNN